MLVTWMRDPKRLWRRGPQRGIARGTAVFGTPGLAADPQALADLLGNHEQLTAWMRTAGLDLEVSVAGLQAVDAMIEIWQDDDGVGPKLGNEVGLFLGGVMVHEFRNARWHLWPNGHPIVRLPSGQEFDVTALAARRLHGGPRLTAVLDEA